MWNPAADQGNESGKIKWELVPYTRGRGLDLGCGPHKPFPHFIGIDSNVDRDLFRIEASGRNLTGDVSSLELFGSESVDFVFSSHTLEHITDYEATLAEWWRVVKVGGFLCLYLPHKDLYPNIGTPGANIDHKHDFVPADIIAAMKRIAPSFDLVRNEDRKEGEEYSFFQVFKKLPGKKKHNAAKQVYLESYLAPKPDKTCAIVRYGAYGDVLQTRSVLPGLKKQGYHITWYCTPRGHEVIKHDPDIDAFVLQDDNQVPADELAQFTEYLRTQYTKVLNFCETVEGVLLPPPDRAIFYWPKAARHIVCDHNYVELQHTLAEVPFDGKPAIRFFATPEEQKWAAELRAKASGPVISIALSGGSVHKIWPHVDTVVARIRLAIPNAVVVLTGGKPDAELAHPWSRDPNVWCKAGEWTIRQTLAFVQTVDLVIGPETGVLNSVSMENMAKILFLSHSTVKNLCRDWVNTIAFAAESVACYPCHQLHTRGFQFCVRHENGCAVCAVAITADHVWAAVKDVMNGLVAGRITDEFDDADVDYEGANHAVSGRTLRSAIE
jgi:ADP-heptose:LPS heptosyltransferase